MHVYLRYIILAAAAITGCASSLRAADADLQLAAVESGLQQEATVKPGHRHIEITVPDNRPRHVDIYALTGQVVKQLTVADGTERVEINPGYYIVRIDRQAVRVVVK